MNRRRAAAVLFALSVPAAAFAWGSGKEGDGKAITQPRKAEGFKRVAVQGELDVEIKEGGAYAVVVTVDGNLQPLVTTEVEGETLVVGQKENLAPSRGAKVAITLPELRGVALNGSGDAKVTGAVANRPLDFELSGSGDLSYDGPAQGVDIDVNGSGGVSYRGSAQALKVSVNGSGDMNAQLSGNLEKVDVEVAGSGDIKLSGGTAQALRVRSAGSGDLDLKGTQAKAVDVSLSGSGDAEVNVAQDGQLNARLTGSGDLGWSGSPREKNISHRGSGRAHQN
ncbi:MAG TPA: head GIN domain-containing protein [Myxococcaceae bacterium]|nr:head GIN domain-containing protein [Myxococcaceae bacterium]